MAHPPAPPLVLSVEERGALEEIASSPSLPYRAVRQAKGLLMAADGAANMGIAEQLGVSRSTVLGWRSRFAEDGVGGWARCVLAGAPSRRSPGEDRSDRGRHPAHDTA